VEIGELVCVPPVVTEPPDKEFSAEVVSVRFADSFKAAHKNAQITGNHWPCELYLGRYSDKAAVYPYGSKAGQNIEVTIKVTSKGYGGKGKLTGSCAWLEFEGEVPLASGQHKVIAKIKEPPNSLAWAKGFAAWGIDLPDTCVLAGVTFLELFFVFKDPSKLKFFSGKGVWTEALRYLFLNGGVNGETIETNVAAKVTHMCFAIPYHKYHLLGGAPHFGGRSGTFKLKNYMQPVKQDLNCYDQAYAVIVFAGATGLEVDGLYIDPFGFLATTNLVGHGRCNNPFPSDKFMSEKLSGAGVGKKLTDYLVVGHNDKDRQPFGNHMYCEFQAKIYDACAGPVPGTVNRLGYSHTAIDTFTTLYAKYPGFHPGTVADMKSIASIGAAVTSVV
jgi:hypothetical protein